MQNKGNKEGAVLLYVLLLLTLVIYNMICDICFLDLLFLIVIISCGIKYIRIIKERK